MGQNLFSPFKMKFSIQEDGSEASEKQIFFTFKEASEKTGILSKRIAQTLRSGRRKYFRRSDKKTFWIQREDKTPFIQIDGEDFFSAEEIQERFGLARTFFFNQLAKKKTHFLDSQEKSHEVTWKSDGLEGFLGRLRERDFAEKVMSAQKRKNMPKNFVDGQAKINDRVEFYLMQFDKPVTSEEAQQLDRQKEILNDPQQKTKMRINGADPM